VGAHSPTKSTTSTKLKRTKERMSTDFSKRDRSTPSLEVSGESGRGEKASTEKRKKNRNWHIGPERSFFRKKGDG